MKFNQEMNYEDHDKSTEDHLSQADHRFCEHPVPEQPRLHPFRNRQDDRETLSTCQERSYHAPQGQVKNQKIGFLNGTFSFAWNVPLHCSKNNEKEQLTAFLEWFEEAY